MTIDSRKHIVYILECADGSLYTGYTVDVKRRLRQHNSNKGAKYTRGRNPCVIRYLAWYNNKSDALRREAEIKKLSRKEKLKLISGFRGDVGEFS